MKKVLMAKFEIQTTFRITGRGLVLAGFITEGTISVGEYIEFTAFEKLRRCRILGVEGLTVSQPSQVNLGLIIRCENDTEIDELRNWQPGNTIALIYKTNSKALIKLTNGFYNGGNGLLMTGTLLNGAVKNGDQLIINPSIKIPIVAVELWGGDLRSIRITLQKEMENEIGTNWRGNIFDVN